MNNDLNKRWIDAATELAVNPSKKVLCPYCEKAFLRVIDVKLGDEKGIERHIQCPQCKRYDALLMRQLSHDAFYERSDEEIEHIRMMHKVIP
ncbi:hypothetical protein JXA32_16795 [Candidatus Sumerlaeota bacterium]|nr:hypothetical protein [Candidatus Sumerlaeota bacterium]